MFFAKPGLSLSFTRAVPKKTTFEVAKNCFFRSARLDPFNTKNSFPQPQPRPNPSPLQPAQKENKTAKFSGGKGPVAQRSECQSSGLKVLRLNPGRGFAFIKFLENNVSGSQF